MPEGWGQSKDDEKVDMEITFTPGLSADNDNKDETTLEKYQRKMREKKRKRKELRGRVEEDKETQKQLTKGIEDDFFGADSDESAEEAEAAPKAKQGKGKEKKGKKRNTADEDEESRGRVESTAEELALLAASDNPKGEVKHFDMKSVLRAEKKAGKKRKGRGKKGADGGENEVQEDFTIDVEDERFKAVFEDHTFAIDPSNPQCVSFSISMDDFDLYVPCSFKKTKSMSALLEERSRRQQEKASRNRESTVTRRADAESQQSSLQSLVESVKRKSAALDKPGMGKRRKVT